MARWTVAATARITAVAAVLVAAVWLAARARSEREARPGLQHPTSLHTVAWATLLLSAGTILFSGLTIYNCRRTIHYSKQTIHYSRQTLENLRRVEQIRAQRDSDGRVLQQPAP